jgi:hypothetical protein
MYKNRITKWALDKKQKGAEVQAIVRKKYSRAAVGQRSEFRVRGRVVNYAKVEQYLRKKGMTEAQVLMSSRMDGSHTPPSLECRTPPTIPSSPTPTEGSVEHLGSALTALRDYYIGSFGSGTWKSHGEGSDCTSTCAGGDQMIMLKNLFSRHDTACGLFDSGKFEEGGKVIMDAFGDLEAIIEAQHPRTIGAVFDLCMFLRLRHRPEIANMLIRQFARLASLRLPARHPLSRIFREIANMNDEDIEEASVRVWTCALDQLDDALGSLHYTSLRSRMEFIQMAEVAKGADRAEATLRHLLDRCKTRLGMEDSRTLKLIDTLAELALDQGKYASAERYAQELMMFAPFATPWSRFIDIMVGGLFIQARVQKSRGQMGNALETLQRAIDLNVSQWGWNYALTLKFLVHQEAWLQEIDETVTAEEVMKVRTWAAGVAETSVPDYH